MAVIALLMIAFGGFFAFLNYRKGRIFWAIGSGLVCLLGVASLWTDYLVMQKRASEAQSTVASEQPEVETEETVFGEYQPDATAADE